MAAPLTLENFKILRKSYQNLSARAGPSRVVTSCPARGAFLAVYSSTSHNSPFKPFFIQNWTVLFSLKLTFDQNIVWSRLQLLDFLISLLLSILSYSRHYWRMRMKPLSLKTFNKNCLNTRGKIISGFVLPITNEHYEVTNISQSLICNFLRQLLLQLS